MPESAPLQIAVVGISALLPGSADADGFWRTVVEGRDLITDVPETHWLLEDYYDPDPAAPDRTYGRRGAFLSPVSFDPLAYGIPPNSLPATDTTQLLSLLVADRLLRDALGDRLPGLDRDRVSVILGTAPLELLATMGSRLQRPVWLKALRESGVPEPQAQAICDRIAGHYVPWQEATFPGLLSNVVAGRIANKLDLHGTNCTVDAACASSLAALSAGVNELALGQADLVVTGGVDTLNDITMYMCFSKTPALSASGDCRPFSDAADGTMLGEGLVMFALKRLADAERDGDHVYAVLQGLGTSSDGRSTAIYAPLSDGQARALRRAYRAAGYGPETVELVEAHGTGTMAGDLAEFTALRSVFEETGRSDGPWCALGSVKSQIGHTKSAAGAAGLLKVVLALHHKVLPPTIKVERPSSRLDLEGGPLYLNTRARPWVAGSGQPRRASVSSFGFGGTNFHLTVEEYVGERPAGRARTAPTELILLSAPTPAELQRRARELAGGSEDLAALARETQAAFAAGDGARLAIVAADRAELTARLGQALDLIDRGGRALPGGIWYASGPAAPGRVGFLFSGQGSQYVGMGADLAMEFPAARAAWDRAAALDLGDRPLHRVVFPIPVFGDAERAAQQALLVATEWAQPALAVQSLAQLALLDALGIRADCAAGHSFGELVALHAAGAFDAEALVRLARRRGEAMRDAASTAGGMTAVSAAREEVEAALASSGVDGVWIANHNGPRQVVVAGRLDALAAVERSFEAAGIATRRLDTATAFHTPLVAPASSRLLEHLCSMRVEPPRIEVFGNGDAGVYPADPDLVRRRLSDHLASPVRFLDEVEAMYADGVRTFIEVGAGSTLTTLVGQVVGDRAHLAVSLDRRGRHGVTALQEALGQLAVAGVAADFAALWAASRPPAEPAQPPSAAAVLLSGANYGKPYPPPGGARDLPAPVEAVAPAPSLPVAAVAPMAPPPQASSAPPAPPLPAAAPLPATADDSWLQAFQEAQRQTLEAHAAYQRTMAETHQAFLEMATASIAALTGAAGGHVLPEFAAAAAGGPALPPPALPLPDPGIVATPAPAPEAPPVPAQPAPAALDLEQVVLAAVAEKTGYPVEMVAGHMDLESDLGIDSIKRVEILAAVRRRAPGLPEADPAELGKLRTLGEIIDRLRAAGPAGARSVPATAAQAPGLAAPAPERQAASEQLTRWTIRAVEAPPPGLALPGLWDGPVAVTGDDAIASHLVEELARTGVRAIPCDEVPAQATGLIHLGGLRQIASVDDPLDVQRTAFRHVRAIAGRLRVLVTVQDTGGDFGLGGRCPDRAWLGGLAALTRTAAREMPDASCKAIDCERGERDLATIARAIARELLAGGPELNVGLSAGGARITLATVETPSGTAAGCDIGPESVIVATGGARGVTAAALIALARAHRPRLALIGRTALEDGVAEPRTPAEFDAARARAEIRATLDALRAAGSEARYLAVDARDAGALAAALEDVRRDWGPVSGIVHGAGVIADRRIAEKTDEQFERVFDTKVAGLRALLSATASDPLRLLCVFSSVAAQLGNAGQCDYAMANEVLSQVASAERVRRGDCRVRAIAWGPWAGGMVNPSLAERFRGRGVALIPVEAGAGAFVAELEDGGADARVMIAAGGTQLESSGPRLRGELQISSRSHPYLADHVIRDQPVLPVVLVLEWFAAAARAWLPEPAVLRDVQVLRRVGLGHLNNGGHRLVVEGEPDGEGLTLRLLGEGGAVHYRASARPGRAGPSEWMEPADLEPLRQPIYDGRVLFHGPRFQALRTVRGVSTAGAAGVLAGSRDLGWNGNGWHTDPAAVDGGLQLALLWADRMLGGAALPMGVAEYRAHRTGPAAGSTRCVLRAGRVGAEEAECDLGFLAEDGSTSAELIGLSLVRRPE